jgi:hypothetical protein
MQIAQGAPLTLIYIYDPSAGTQTFILEDTEGHMPRKERRKEGRNERREEVHKERRKQGTEEIKEKGR